MIQILIRLWNYIRVKNAIVYAKKMHKETGIRYYVLPLNGKIRVISKLGAEALVRQKRLKKCMKEHYSLCKYAIYYTE